MNDAELIAGAREHGDYRKLSSADRIRLMDLARWPQYGYFPNDDTKILGELASLRACIRQAVEDVEKLPHGEMCQSNVDWLSPPPCNCGHDETIASLKEGLGDK